MAGKRVLLVDDDTELVSSLAEQLQLHEEYDTVVAHTASEGHCHLNRGCPQGTALIPFQVAALALSHTLKASARNRLKVDLLSK